MTAETIADPGLDGWTLVGDFDGLGEFLASVGADSATWVDADPAALAAYEARVADDLAQLDALEAAEAAEEAAMPTPTPTVVPDPPEADDPEPEADAPWMRLFATPADFDGTGEPHPHLLATTAGGVLLYADATNWVGGEYKSGKKLARPHLLGARRPDPLPRLRDHAAPPRGTHDHPRRPRPDTRP